MKRIGMFSLPLCLIVLAAGSALGQYPSAGAPMAMKTEISNDLPISMQLKDISVRKALEALFQLARTTYVIDMSVGDDTMPSVSFNNVSFQTALESITRSAGLVYRIDGEVVSVSKKPQTGIIIEPADGPGPGKVSIKAKQQKVGPALTSLFHLINADYTLPAEASSISFDLSAPMVDPYEALRKVIQTARLHATPGITGSLPAGTVVKLELEPWFTNPVSINYQNMPMTEALIKLLSQVGQDKGLRVEPGVPNTGVVLTTNKLPFIKALGEFAQAAGVSYSLSPDGFVIYPARTEDKIIDLEVKDTPLNQVIEDLFKGTDASYTIDPSIGALKVTAKLKNVSFDEALKTLARASGIVYRVEGGHTYSISPKPNASADSLSNASRLGGLPSGQATAQPTVTEVVTLRQKQISSGDIASVISKPGKVSVTTVGSDKLLITGSKEDVDEALKLARALDTDTTLSKPIRIKLEAKVTSPSLKEPAILTTESVGAEGSNIPLNAQTQTTIPYLMSVVTVADGKQVENKVQQFINVTGGLFVNLVPTLSEDGRINLSGSGRFAHMFLGEKKSGPVVPDQINIDKNFEVAASIPQGKPTIIATASTETDRYTAKLEITAIAVVEEGMVRAPVMDNNRQFPGYTVGYPSSGYGGSYGGSSFGGYTGPYGGYGGSYGGYMAPAVATPPANTPNTPDGSILTPKSDASPTAGDSSKATPAAKSEQK